MKALWIRVDAHKVDSREVGALADALAIDEVFALGYVVALGGAVAEHTDDGNIADVSDATIERWARWRGKRGAFAPALRRAFQSEGGEYANWHEEMGQLVERRARDRARKDGKGDGNSVEIPRKQRADSMETGRDSTATERYGTERNGSASISLQESVNKRSGDLPGAGARETAAAAAPLAVAELLEQLPADAVRFHRVYYAAAPEPRQLDIARQLVLSLSIGARFDRRTTIKAGSPDRLAAKCREVLDEHLRDPDKAIRVLLLKLADTSDGAAPGQQAARAATSAAETEERATAAELTHAEAWIADHPDVGRELDRQLDADGFDAPDEIVQRSRAICRRALVLGAWRSAGRPEAAHV